MSQQSMIRPLSQHMVSTSAVRIALQRAGYKATLEVRYAEFHEYTKDGKERHAILMWDSNEGEYRAGHVVLSIKDGYWRGEFEQGNGNEE